MVLPSVKTAIFAIAPAAVVGKISPIFCSSLSIGFNFLLNKNTAVAKRVLLSSTPVESATASLFGFSLKFSIQASAIVGNFLEYSCQASIDKSKTAFLTSLAFELIGIGFPKLTDISFLLFLLSFLDA